MKNHYENICRLIGKASAHGHVEGISEECTNKYIDEQIRLEREKLIVFLEAMKKEDMETLESMKFPDGTYANGFQENLIEKNKRYVVNLYRDIIAKLSDKK